MTMFSNVVFHRGPSVPGKFALNSVRLNNINGMLGVKGVKLRFILMMEDQEQESCP